MPFYVSEIRGKPFEIYYRNIGEGDYALTADALVRSILSAWGKDTKLPDNLSSTSDRARELSVELGGKVPQPGTRWIIVDGLGKFPPDHGLREFVMELAKYIAESTHPLRLVLLDLGDQHPLSPEAEQLAIQVNIDRLTCEDLMEHYFNVLYSASTPALPIPAAQMETKALWVLDQGTDKAANGKALVTLKIFLRQGTKELGLA